MIHVGTGDYDGNKAIEFYKKRGFKKVGYLEDINPKSKYSYGQLLFGFLVD
ncbi:MAG: hypothetical protein K0B02_01790 [DPANN group archaeon]|nr:hypothetical protein [DPANN group archaeon]